MHPRYLDDFESEIETIRSLSNSGFVMAFNILGLRGIQYIHNEYPEEWIQIYTQRAYHVIDPVFAQSNLSDCQIRWSEIKISAPIASDLVKKQAAKYGLKYGAVISIQDGLRSILSCARDDREFEDSEIELLTEMFRRILSGSDAVRLGSQHTEILRRLRKGDSQKELSAALSIPYPTVRKRLQEIYLELGVKTPAQAVGEAVDRGLL